METWREIVAEMREESDKGPNLSEPRHTQKYAIYIGLCADRVEAACKTLEDLLIVEQEENEKLRRALEPVMDVVLGGCSLTDSYCAVREAQAIMKEGK